MTVKEVIRGKPNACPSVQALSEYVSADWEDKSQYIKDHLETCEACKSLYLTLLQDFAHHLC